MEIALTLNMRDDETRKARSETAIISLESFLGSFYISTNPSKIGILTKVLDIREN